MSAMFLVSTFGQIKSAAGTFVENVIYPLDSTITGDAEITGLVSNGYVQVFASNGAAQTFLNTYVTLAQRALSGELDISQPLVNTPAKVTTLQNAQSTLAAANATVLTTKAVHDALAATSAGTLVADLATATSAYAAAQAAVTSAQSALTAAQAAIVNVPYVRTPTPVPAVH